MSDIKDEIDWEFPGATTTEGQSNFFWQGIIRMLHFIWIRMDLSSFFLFSAATKSNGGTHGGLSDTFSNYHDYTVSQSVTVSLVKC